VRRASCTGSSWLRFRPLSPRKAFRVGKSAGGVAAEHVSEGWTASSVALSPREARDTGSPAKLCSDRGKLVSLSAALARAGGRSWSLSAALSVSGAGRVVRVLVSEQCRPGVAEGVVSGALAGRELAGDVVTERWSAPEPAGSVASTCWTALRLRRRCLVAVGGAGACRRRLSRNVGRVHGA
jgi:hypothetical protein